MHDDVIVIRRPLLQTVTVTDDRGDVVTVFIAPIEEGYSFADLVICTDY